MKVHDLQPAPGSRRPKRRVGRGIGGKGATGAVVDDLRADVLVGPEHGQAGTGGGAGHVLAHAVVPPRPGNLLVLG